jgi:hypothetical protein
MFHGYFIYILWSYVSRETLDCILKKTRLNVSRETSWLNDVVFYREYRCLGTVAHAYFSEDI